MDSATIGKISKAREYALEPERMTLSDFVVIFNGKHQTYQVAFQDGAWHCECEFFVQRGFCSHSMAVKKVLDKTGMVLPEIEQVAA